MNKIKILYVHHSGFFGGASNSLISVLKNIPSNLFEIYILTPKGNVIPHFKNITNNVREFVVQNPPTFFPSLEGVKFTAIRSLIGLVKNYDGINEVLSYIEEVNPDLVHFNESIFVPVIRKLRKKKYKVLVHARSKPANKRTIFDYIGDYYLNKYSDVLLCINQSVFLGFPGVNKKIILKNPLQFTQDKIESLKQQPPKKYTDHNFNCLFLSNLFDYKGVKETIQSAIMLKDFGVHFYIAGTAPRRKDFFERPLGRILDFTGLYPNLVNYIERAIKEHDLTNVHLLGHVDDIQNLFKVCHLNLAPMWLDAPPRSIFEAGAFGIPTILALKKKNSDTIIHGKNGLLIDPKNATQLSKAILFLKDNPEIYSEMSKEIKNSSLTDHSPEEISKKLIDIYYCLV